MAPTQVAPKRTPGGRRGPRSGASELELEVERLAAGGDGVGRAPDGRVVFVPFTAPGDRVRVRVVEERRRYLRARVLELLAAGPGRTDPLCAVFGSCGGCSWQHLDYPTQLDAKADILRDAFARIAHVTPPASLEIVPSPRPYGYRGRARLQVRGGRVGFLRRRSHAVCATARCPVLAPELDGALASLAAAPPEHEGEWEIAVGSDDHGFASSLPPDAPRPAVELQVGEDRLRVSAGVFAQANVPLRGALVAAVAAAAGRGGEALELHAGAGLFTLALARRFEQVVAVETDAAAVADLEVNLARAGLSGVTVLGTSAEAALEEPPGRPEVVVLDPPRTGLAAGSAEALARLGAARIVYVSCDPATLARDVGVCADRGWNLASLKGFDLFPQTAHVEALAVLEREG